MEMIGLAKTPIGYKNQNQDRKISSSYGDIDDLIAQLAKEVVAAKKIDLDVHSGRSLTLPEPTDIPLPPESQTDRVDSNVPVKVVNAPAETSSCSHVRIKRKPEVAAAPQKRLRSPGAAPSIPIGIADDANAAQVTIIVLSENAGVAAVETGGVSSGDPNVVVGGNVVIALSSTWEGPPPYSAEILSLLPLNSIPNPVYLFQGIVLRKGAKGTGMKSVELALSMCDIVDMYGFTVDPGYTEWTRYFSEPKQGHNPLQGRAYYQLLECLGVIRIHSPMRSKRKQDWSDVPSREMIGRAHAAALRLKRGPDGDLGRFGSCKVWGNVDPENIGPVSGSPDMSDVRKSSNYSKWEVLPFESLRKEAQDHYNQMEGVSLYKMDGNKLDDLVCVRHSSKSEV